MKKLLSLLMVVSFMITTMSLVSKAEGLKGDANADGKVNSTDALNVLQYVVGTLEKVENENNADVNSDGVINSVDALEILKIAVGIVNPADPTNPTTKSEIIDCYNNAINKVINEKAGFTKTTTSQLDKLEGAEALMKIKVAKDAVYDFLGVGDNVFLNEKGTSKWLKKSSLSDADVTSATCIKDGNNLKITLNLKDGSSSAPNGTDTSPISRCGLYSGSNVEKEYDYKNAANFYKGINEADDTSVQSIKESTQNAKIVAVVDSETGKLVSLDIAFDWNVELTRLKYTVIVVSGKGYAKTSVKVSDIVW